MDCKLCTSVLAREGMSHNDVIILDRLHPRSVDGDRVYPFSRLGNLGMLVNIYSRCSRGFGCIITTSELCPGLSIIINFVICCIYVTCALNSFYNFKLTDLLLDIWMYVNYNMHIFDCFTVFESLSWCSGFFAFFFFGLFVKFWFSFCSFSFRYRILVICFLYSLYIVTWLQTYMYCIFKF